MITSPSNPIIKSVKGLHRQRGRKQARQFIVEGLRLVEEALRAGHIPALMFYTPNLEKSARGQNLLTLARDASLRPILVSERIMRAAATTKTPQDVLAVVPWLSLPWPKHPDLLLILDQLRDPGNMGSVLRTAEAAGVKGVLFSPGTVDVYNPKVVRGAMGAHFRLSFRAATWPDIEEATQGLQTWLAEIRDGVPYYQVDWLPPSALIIGNEASGASIKARKLAQGQTYIPMLGQAESLNAAVAAGIIIFEAIRQRALAQKQLL